MSAFGVVVVSSSAVKHDSAVNPHPMCALLATTRFCLCPRIQFVIGRTPLKSTTTRTGAVIKLKEY